MTGADHRGRMHDDHYHPDPAAPHDHDGADVPEYDRGLGYDLGILGRRRMLGLMAGAGLIPLVGALRIGSTASASTLSASTLSASALPTSALSAATCVETPEETAGPFPGDGSNGPNVLDDTGIVRKNIRSSFGGPTGYAAGIPLTVRLTLLDSDNDCKPRRGAAIYVWQCDREGRYSMYSAGVTDENYLRGVQRADKAGTFTFKTTFPGCYPGRWPHIHFEVYPSLAEATTWTNKIATSQLALPEHACREVYATDGYEQSLVNIDRVSLETDGVFRDGWETQLAKVRGDVSTRYEARLAIAL